MVTGRPSGRPAKSVNKKISEGNLGKRKLSPVAPSNPNSEIPSPPSTLGEDGKKVWNIIFSVAKEYVDPNVDILQAEMFAHLYEETEMMRRMLSLGSAAGGVDRVIYTNNGKTITRHPFVQDVKENRVMMNSILAAFGFTPADRARLSFEKQQVNSVLETMKELRASAGTFKVGE